MKHDKLMLALAALAGTMLAASAGAQDQSRSSMDRAGVGVVAPSSASEVPVYEPLASGGQAVMPRVDNRMNPNESGENLVDPQPTKAARGDNPNLPNPVTPTGSNESAPQPQSQVREHTNQSGMRDGPVGATR